MPTPPGNRRALRHLQVLQQEERRHQQGATYVPFAALLPVIDSSTIRVQG